MKSHPDNEPWNVSDTASAVVISFEYNARSDLLGWRPAPSVFRRFASLHSTAVNMRSKTRCARRAEPCVVDMFCIKFLMDNSAEKAVLRSVSLAVLAM